MGFGYSHEVRHDGVAYDRETGARVGAVHTTSQAAHVWAQGNVTFGRSSKGVVYFHGRALFDYGSHYCAAYLCADGESVLINGESVSPTTSGHVHTAMHAAYPRTLYTVPNLTELLAPSGYSELHVPAYASGGSVEGTAEWEAEIDARLSDREHVRAYCEKYALEMDAESMQFLLAGAGLPNSATKIVREAEARRDREQAAAAKRDRDRAVDTLRTFAKTDDVPAYVLEWHGLGYGSPYGYTALGVATQFAKTIRAARSAAGKDNTPPTFWREAWNRLKRLEPDAPDSFVPAIAEEIARRNRAADLASKRRNLRHALDDWNGLRPLRYTVTDSDHIFQRLNKEADYANARAASAYRLALAIDSSFPKTGRKLHAGLMSLQDSLSSYAAGIRTAPLYDKARESWEAEREARRAAEAERARLKEAADLESWLAGDRGVRVYASRAGGAAYIRAVDVERNAAGEIVRGTLETSQGADVPLVQAIRAFRFIKLVRDRGTPWHANGAQVRVGHFRVDRITAAGDMRAGCHSFQWQDIETLARDLGVFELAPDDSAVTRSKEAA